MTSTDMAAAHKKYTQFLFDDIQNPYYKKLHGEVGLMYQIFQDFAELRKTKRITQHELAKKCQMSQSYIAKFEAGRANPTLKQLVKLVDGLDLKVGLVEKTFKDIW